MLPILHGIARIAFLVVVGAAIGTALAAGVSLYYFSRDLPDHRQIADYVPAVGSKVYDANGTLIAEFETERRIPVPIAKVPRLVIDAFLAAEDRDFYAHQGVDPGAILRAAMADITRFHRGQRPIGASTITQQVVRHFLLSREVSIARKVREAILAYRIERTLSKERILEIYLNEIYFGTGAYGVAAAADTYFQKPLDRLTLAEAAFLAALPKAPNKYHPIRHAAAAKARRDWVVAGMAEMGWISEAQARSAMAEPLAANMRPDPQREHTGYFTEEVRRELVARFGENSVYEGGMTVRTSYMPAQQEMAETAFRNGLVEYDRRHGWRGPVARLGSAAAARRALAEIADPQGIGDWQLAAVADTDAGGATIVLRNGAVGQIPIGELRWARPTLKDQRLGRAVRKVTDVLAAGDILLVEPLAAASGKGRRAEPSMPLYGLRQMPDISGGLVVMDPQTGRIFALVGGWSFQQSQFNRSVQARRQPGSAIKPFVYLTALLNGFEPWNIIDDAPIEMSQGPGLPPWRPVNYDGDLYGPMTLEDALIHSRNLATARLAAEVGLPAIARTVQDFDIMDRMPLYHSMSLGAGETTLLRLTNAYAMLNNGGRWLLPSVIDLVQDRDGRVLYQKGVKECVSCFVSAGPRTGNGSSPLYRASGAPDPAAIPVPNVTYAENPVLYQPTKPDPLVDPKAVREIVAMLQSVVQRGTGTLVQTIGKPLAGKTGTTSDWFDAWFVGFSPDLVAGVYVGFDEPRTMGNGETGGYVAATIFRDFMKAALKDRPAKPFPPPPGADGNATWNEVSVTGETGSGGAVSETMGPNSDSEDAADDPREAPERRAARREPDYPAPPPPPWGHAPPQWSGYGSRPYVPPPRPQDYIAAVPAYPAPWGRQYAPPGWGGGYAAPPVPRYAPGPAYPAPAYAAPNWGAGPGPGYGTGGLY